MILDQKPDIALEKIYSKESGIAPQESDGYFLSNGLLLHRKYLTNERNKMKYVDRIVVPDQNELSKRDNLM